MDEDFELGRIKKSATNVYVTNMGTSFIWSLNIGLHAYNPFAGSPDWFELVWLPICIVMWVVYTHVTFKAKAEMDKVNAMNSLDEWLVFRQRKSEL